MHQHRRARVGSRPGSETIRRRKGGRRAAGGRACGGARCSGVNVKGRPEAAAGVRGERAPQLSRQ